MFILWFLSLLLINIAILPGLDLDSEDFELPNEIKVSTVLFYLFFSPLLLTGSILYVIYKILTLSNITLYKRKEK